MSIELGVTVVEAQGLTAPTGLLNRGSARADAYAVIEYEGEKHKTKTIKNNLNPKWGESFSFTLAAPLSNTSSPLTVRVYHASKIGKHKQIGEAEVKLAFLRGVGTDTTFYKLKEGGRIKLTLTYTDPDKGSRGGARAEPAAASGEQEEEAEEEIDVNDPEAVAKRQAKAEERAKQRSLTRSNTAYSTKPQDFQIRIRVWEARNLQSMDSVNAVAKVSLLGQRRQTRIQRTNASPLFNESFFFNVRESPAKLMDEPIILEVFNARRLRRDALIGAFRLETGLVYEQDGRAILRKWVMLSNPKDASGVTGYLKVSIYVLGAGDEAPLEETTTAADEEDVESNLLRPPGMNPEPSDLMIKVFKGEDLPQTDPSFKTGIRAIDRITKQEDKDDCDPYFKASFAGRTRMTAAIDNTYNPNWMQELHLSLMLPSMCDKVKLQIYDSDLGIIGNSDDLVATQYLHMKHISSTSPEYGFLPAFGPCFVNFYGAPREFGMFTSDFSESLNAGVGEGCSFRGRVLLEMVSQPPSGDEKTVELAPNEGKRAEPFQQRKGYMLFLELLDVNMVDSSLRNEPLQIELSMGLFGDSSEHPKEELQGKSMTFPTTALFDGDQYYYIPFEEKKPCLQLASEWEDIDYRMISYNILKNMKAEIDQAVQKLAAFLALTHKPEAKEIALFGELLQALRITLEACRTALPELPDTAFTRLDQNLRDWRESEKMAAAEIASDLLRLLEHNDRAQLYDEGLPGQLDDLAARLRDMVFEAQLSIPDAVVWLIAHNKRKAYVRIPAVDIFCAEGLGRGSLCGKISTLLMHLPRAGPKATKTGDMPAQIQFRAWFGPRDSQSSWAQFDCPRVVVVETFENHRFLPMKGWGSQLLPTDRPKWSDRAGKHAQNPDDVLLPKGWVWRGPWYISPERVTLDDEASLHAVTEEVFENQRYYPIRGWSSKLLPTDRAGFSSEDGADALNMEEMELPPGWEWQDGSWVVDTARAVDGDGWEYAFDFSREYYPAKKKKHFVRRRRHIRTRVRTAEYEIPQRTVVLPKADGMAERDGDENAWEYAIDFGRKFSQFKRKRDFVRRRRWHRERELLPNDDERPQEEEDLDEDARKKLFSLGSFFVHQQVVAYQLRAYIYQGRDLLSEDSNGLSDPFVQVVFSHRSGKTSNIKQKTCPFFDEVLVLDVALPSGVERNTDVACEVFDWDNIGSNDFLGRFTVQPIIRTRHRPAPAELHWHKITRQGEPAGELLAAFELVPMSDVPLFPLPASIVIRDECTKKRKNVVRLPADVRPETELARIDVLAWGLRRLIKPGLQAIASPSVQVECGGTMVETPRLLDFARHPNFRGLTRESTRVVFALEYDFEARLGRPWAPSAKAEMDAQVRKGLLQCGIEVGQLEYLRNTVCVTANKAAVERVHCALEENRLVLELDGRQCRASYGYIRSPHCLLSLEVLLPHKEEYTPPLNIRVVDNRNFGRKPIVGVHSIATLTPYVREPRRDEAVWRAELARKKAFQHQSIASAQAARKAEVALRIEADAPKPKPATKLNKTRNLLKALMFTKGGAKEKADFVLDDTIDWWSKYFASRGIAPPNQPKYEGDTMLILRSDLEKAYPVDASLSTLELFRGKDDKRVEAGQFKGNIVVFTPYAIHGPEVGEIWQTLPSAEAVDLIVRVYVVRAYDLQPQDFNGRVDAYVQIHLGNKRVVKDNKNYIPSNLNPTFSRYFEFEATVPIDAEMRVSVWDYDTFTSDDLVGETVIDLENRLISASRATCGLAKTYTTSGICAWRDSLKPSEILAQYCTRHKLDKPVIDGTQVTVALLGHPPRTFEAPATLPPEADNEVRMENACLQALHAAELIPEHIELRPLYNPLYPDIEQGKLEMWVDIFRKAESDNLPPPVAIDQRVPKSFQLRIIVRNTKDVALVDTNLVGQKMTDIYVKAFIRGIEDRPQKTDVHYRSLNGEGMFNWRMLFDFDYLPTEDAVVVRKKTGLFTRDKNREEVKLPPVLSLQIWDNDLFSPDDYVGSIDLRLSGMAPPHKSARSCHMPGPEPVPEEDLINIFEAKRIKGWYPCVKIEPKKGMLLQGKVEIEMELLTSDDAADKPAGTGRSDPNQFPTLTKPKRPATSFLWITSPWKTLRYVLWARFKWWILFILFLILVILFIALLIYNTPFFIQKKLFGDIGGGT